MDLPALASTQAEPTGFAGWVIGVMEALGGQHAIDAIGVINKITEYKDELPIQYARGEFEMPSQKPPVGADMMRNRMLVDNLLPLGPNGERPVKDLVVMEDDPEHPFKMEIKILKLGDVAWVDLCIAGEVCDHGDALEDLR